MAAIAVGGATMIASPAQAAENPQPKIEQPLPAVVSDAELADRQAKFWKSQDKPAADRPAEMRSGEPSESPRTIDPKIIGGVNAPSGEAPWMTQLYYQDADGNGYFCGGALIAPSKVLTAAHCAYGVDWVNTGYVVAGATQLATESSLNGGKAAAVKRVWINPGYNDDTLKGDVAVLTLDRPLPFKTLSTVTPTDTASYTAGTNATVYGWGRTTGTPGSGITETLQKATLPIQADSACPGFAGGQDFFVPGQMLCAGNPASGADAGTVSPCNGDSGGPLIVNGRIAGVVSWGAVDCVEKGARSVYAKMSAFSVPVTRVLNDANLTDDNKADLFARKSAGAAYIYTSRGTSLGSPEAIGDWSGVNLVRQTDFNRDSNQDLVYRMTNGDLYVERAQWSDTTEEYTWLRTKIGAGWQTKRNITFPGDLSGDLVPDVVASDTAGNLFMWKGRTNGTLQPGVKIGSGWSTYSVFGNGDFSGDGKPDLIARDSSARMWMYKGTGSATAPLGSRVLAGAGWKFTAYATTGDMSGDGKPDFIVRDSAGAMWAWKGTGSATSPFSGTQKIKIGAGWNGFNVFG
ncbi:trypsin-like serine protease [Streptomyces sp. NPDC051219]|uniref:trypsin-like serine protease n=1 Tax=Streptomyces sp. NPDC051219 TaxID=3155283 RepID=UPI00341570FA